MVTPKMSRSSTTTERPPAARRGKLDAVTPGEILREEFLRPLAISQYRLAKAITVPPRRINEIVHGKRAITADTALRLARYFGTSERFWLNLQTRHDLEVEKDRLGARLVDEVQVRPRAG
jgi:addiction module HigA family antidote